MITENTENANKDANVGAQSAAVAPEKAPSKKAARRKMSAPQEPEGRQADGGQPSVRLKELRSEYVARTHGYAPCGIA